MIVTINEIVVVVAVFACLLHTSATDTARPIWTCHSGAECASCAGDKVKTVRLPTGEITQVCCPGCASRYFRYGVTSSGDAYCFCSFVGVSGTVGKGEECSAPGMTIYPPTMDNMPLCCPDPKIIQYSGRSSYNGDGRPPWVHNFNCIVNGNCWRGSQCDACNQGFVRTMLGAKVCCPDCGPGRIVTSRRPRTYCGCV